MSKLKQIIGPIILILSIQVWAAPQVPYIYSEGGREALVISETNEGKVYLSGCVVSKTAVKYLDNAPICSQAATCTRGETATNAIVENSILRVTFNCAISSANAGCRSQTWQKCAMDRTLPDEFDESCLSDNPGTTKAGCPKINSQAPSSPSAKGSR
jgi:hypothetical protein